MASNSRIRFNPVTKEIEVEGTEKFVKTYFDKLQAMISGAAEKKVASQERTESCKGTSPRKRPGRLPRGNPGKRGSPISTPS